jgi:hypothetical protein
MNTWAWWSIGVGLIACGLGAAYWGVLADWRQRRKRRVRRCPKCWYEMDAGAELRQRLARGLRGPAQVAGAGVADLGKVAFDDESAKHVLFPLGCEPFPARVTQAWA